MLASFLMFSLKQIKQEGKEGAIGMAANQQDPCCKTTKLQRARSIFYTRIILLIFFCPEWDQLENIVSTSWWHGSSCVRNGLDVVLKGMGLPKLSSPDSVKIVFPSFRYSCIKLSLNPKFSPVWKKKIYSKSEW